MDVHFSTTYGVIGKLLTDVTEADKQRVLQFLNNFPDNMQAARWSIRFNIEDRQPSLPSMGKDNEIKEDKYNANVKKSTKGSKRQKN